MGVRFFDKESMSPGKYITSPYTSCNSHACSEQVASSSTTTSTTATQTTNSFNNDNNLDFENSVILREIVGNYKEMRIEDNSYNIRIIGNNNRIRITSNVGDITIIGNNTRLKIKKNHGHIKYTGNDGHISLGKDSTEQLVDYSGCNGVLKVQNSEKSYEGNDCDEIKNSRSMRSTIFNMKLNNNKKLKEEFKCHTDYNSIFTHKKLMTNITTKLFHRENIATDNAHQLSKSIVHNFDNIVIANSSNISISPQYYAYS